MEIRNHTKTIAAILTTLVILCSALLVPTLAYIPGKSTTSGASYAVFEGTAASDYYDSRQYSYAINSWAAANVAGYPALGVNNNPSNVSFDAGKSLRIGFTEYGELCTPVNAGIAYGNGSTEWGNTESWCPSVADIPSQYWIQGWQFAMNYTREGDPYPVSLEAYALYSNLNTSESGRAVYSWWGPVVPNSITLGKLVPMGVEILYDSARLVVARSTVIIQDGLHNFEDVAAVISTLVYDKDTKYAELYQDVKVLLSVKVLQNILVFSFSDRYELDMAAGVNAGDRSFVHYFANYAASVYQNPLTGTNNYDVIQAFDPSRQYIFFAGYWPNATEYTVYNPVIVPADASGLSGVLQSGTAVADMPLAYVEPHIPWVTVQWLYTQTQWPNLTSWLAGGEGQMRFVEVPGMTDYNKKDPHPALDLNASDTSNQLDTEVLYLLNQVFNPTSLNSLANGGAGTTLGQGSTIPFMWIGLGQSAATTDSGAAAMVGGNSFGTYTTALSLFDRNDTAFPYLNPVVTMQGSIPYGLSNFNGTYSETISNSALGTGADTTSYMRTALNGFALGYNTATDPQPIAGGYGYLSTYWYPSKNPLSQRWSNTAGTYTLVGYDTVFDNPNGILTLGGMKANGLTRYFNDFDYAISREGTAGTYDAVISNGVSTGTVPTSNSADATLDYFPISTWNVNSTTFGYADTSANAGYAVISLASDINGTRGLSIYGWNGRDTYWATAWASQYIVGNTAAWLPAGTVSLVLKITYVGSSEPTAFTVVKALGTITEFGTNDFATAYKFDNRPAVTWSGAFTVPATPNSYYGNNVWWSAKLPTGSTAKVDYDP